jgi:hypothetical protein
VRCGLGPADYCNINRSITDASGALIPEVAVKVINTATNASRIAQTDASGTYTIPFLAAGAYRITAEKAGSQAQHVEQLTLQVGQTARLDLKLQVGEVTETVMSKHTAQCCKPRTPPWAP